jgi:hypothetical protein
VRRSSEGLVRAFRDLRSRILTLGFRSRALGAQQLPELAIVFPEQFITSQDRGVKMLGVELDSWKQETALGAKEEFPGNKELLELLLMFLGIIFSFPDSVSQYLFIKSVKKALHFHVDSQSFLFHPQFSPSPSLSSAKLLLQILKGAAIFRFRAHRKNPCVVGSKPPSASSC